MSKNSTVNPFGEIALCFSGGGYRAAAFHLGTLKMLKELDLLDSAKYLSTASGGTILAVKYAIEKIERGGFAKDEDFSDFEHNFKEYLLKNNVIKKSLDTLYTNQSPTGKNDLSLIRCASDVYHNELFKGNHKTFDTLLNHVNKTKDVYFKDLIFNATDFRGGNSFRFRACHNQLNHIGNRNMQVKRELAAKLRLGDIVAASSCFPGAFEPIRFPDDFVLHTREFDSVPFLNTNKVNSVPLMDGGIFDNQGVSSMILSYKNLSENPVPFGLMIVSDTCQRNPNFMEFPAVAKKGFVKIQWLAWLLVLAWFVIFFAITVIAAKSAIQWQNSLDAFIYFYLPLALEFAIFLIGALVILLWTQFQKIKISLEDFAIWEYIKRINILDLWTILDSRIKSAKAMTFEVFMKRIRMMTVNEVMDNERFQIKRQNQDKNESPDTIVAFNYIYDLDVYGNALKGISNSQYNLEPSAIEENYNLLKQAKIPISDSLIETSNDAEKVGTSLWFAAGRENDLDNLIECGRVSGYLCLIKYLLKNRVEEIKDENSDFKKFYDSLVGKWNEIIKH